MEAPTSFGLWLRHRRKALDLTQEELAQRVGCSVSAIRKIESDERRPSRQIADLLAQALEVPEEDRAVFIKVARGERRVERLPVSESPGLSQPLPVPAAPAPFPQPPAASPPLRPAPKLPSPPTPLIGREPERAEIARLLCNSSCRLLTLTGPGGIGKTRLAIQVATDFSSESTSACACQFEDQVFFVSLAPVVSTEFIVPAIAEAVGLAFYGRDELRLQLQAYLRDKCALIVLDNLEHLLQPGDEVALEDPWGIEILTEILRDAPNVKLLVTSRERLNLQGEWVFEIQGLPVPPMPIGSSLNAPNLENYSAVALFLQNARRVRPTFSLNSQNQADVVRICHLMDGLPLGIELAATWVRVLSTKEIVQEIERNLDFLSTNVRGLPERHRSLRAAFDYSWNLLSEAEQHALRQLSVFRGGFRREAAQEVAQASLPVLSGLVDKSLLRRGPSSRYDMQELVRQYAEKRLQEAGEYVQTRNRHLEYYLSLAEQAEPELWRSQQVSWLDQLSEEYNNLRAALEWSLHETAEPGLGLRLAGALWRFWTIRGYVSEGREWLERTLSHSQAAGPDVHARALNGLGLLAWRQGDYAAARQFTEQSAALWREIGSPTGLANAWNLLGLLELRDGDETAARSLLEQSVSLFRQEADRVGLALSLNSLGELARHQGDLPQAEQLYTESLTLYRELGHKRGQADLLHNLGYVSRHNGQYAEAASLFRESLDLELEQGNRRGIAECLIGLAAVMSKQGQPRRAASLFAAAAAQLKELGAVLEPTDQAEYERSLAETRRQLPDAEWDAAWEEGISFSPAIAIAYALSDLGE